MLTQSHQSLYSIRESPDLMSDACVCNDAHQLIFVSLWGRDTAMQEFLARLTLGNHEKGLDSFNLILESASDVEVLVGNLNRIEKRTTRVFKRTLFGSLVHLWLFDHRCREPDKANGKAFALIPRNTPNRDDRLWMLTKDTCPLPLLDHWRDTVLDLLRKREMLSPISWAIGPVEGFRLAIDTPALTSALGELIQTGILDVAPELPQHASGLQQAA